MVELSLIDSHAHIDMGHYDNDRREVIERAAQTGVGIINMGTDLQASRSSLTLGQENQNIFSAVGFHPHNADQLVGEDRSSIRQLAGEDGVIAIGEIGLDYYRDNSPRPQQQEALQEQIEIALDLDLPICIHNRSSTDDLLEILRGYSTLPRGVIHSFFGSPGLAEEFRSLGFSLGISGPITYGENDQLEKSVQNTPLDDLLIETDSPYLTPEPHRGERNEPSYVKYVAHEIARIKDRTYDEVKSTTTKNAVKLFGLEGEND